MTLEITNKTLIPVSDVSKILSHISYGTVRNWYMKGCVSHATGERVLLDVIQIGHRFFTSRDSVDTFIRKLNGGAGDGHKAMDDKHTRGDSDVGQGRKAAGPGSKRRSGRKRPARKRAGKASGQN